MLKVTTKVAKVTLNKGYFEQKVTLVGLQGRGATQSTLSSKENCLTFNLDTQQVLPIVPLLWDMNEIY
jgi:hypothetical protein